MITGQEVAALYLQHLVPWFGIPRKIISDRDPMLRVVVTRIAKSRLRGCYAQALGVVDVGSLLVELSGKVRVRSGRPSCRASQGQNHGVRCGYKGSGEVRQSA